MKRTVFLILLHCGTVLALQSWAGFGAASVGAGGASDASVEGAEALFHNPARIGPSGKWEFMIDYNSPYFIQNWNEFAVSAVRAFKGWDMGVGICGRFAGNAYRENDFMLALAVPLGSDVRAGAKASLFSFALPGSVNGEKFGRMWALTFDLGISWTFLKYFTVAYVKPGILTPVLSFTGDMKDPQPSPHTASLSVRYPENISWNLQFDDLDRIAVETLGMGMEFRIKDTFSGMIGLYHSNVTAGMGLCFTGLELDLGVLFQENLGMDCHITVKYKI